MRLLDAEALIYDDVAELVEFSDESKAPPYAILSHTWDNEEVLFADIALGPQHEIQPSLASVRVRRRRQAWLYLSNCDSSMHKKEFRGLYEDLTAHVKAGWNKVFNACLQTIREGLGYIWIDTCCIDKASSAELSEAINSMYRWYASATMCFAYLSDCQRSTEFPLPPTFEDSLFIKWKGITWGQSLGPEETLTILKCIENCRWFTRGWTLQELIAPREVNFFDQHWRPLATRGQIPHILEEITGVHVEALFEPKNLHETDIDVRPHPSHKYSVAQRMFWASRRETTRKEDEAYCLLGLFAVNIPLLYGEGSQAFQRLQQEIIRTSTDQSVFAWEIIPNDKDKGPSLSILAPSPANFWWRAHEIVPAVSTTSNSTAEFRLTNEGIQITPALDGHGMSQGHSPIIAALNCEIPGSRERIGIWIQLHDIVKKDDQHERYKASFATAWTFPRHCRLIAMSHAESLRGSAAYQLLICPEPSIRFRSWFTVFNTSPAPVIAIEMGFMSVMESRRSRWNIVNAIPPLKTFPYHSSEVDVIMTLPLERKAFGAIAVQSRCRRRSFTIIITFSGTQGAATHAQDHELCRYWILPGLDGRLYGDDRSHTTALRRLCEQVDCFEAKDYFENTSKRRDSCKVLKLPTKELVSAYFVRQDFAYPYQVLNLKVEKVANPGELSLN